MWISKLIKTLIISLMFTSCQPQEQGGSATIVLEINYRDSEELEKTIEILKSRTAEFGAVNKFILLDSLKEPCKVQIEVDGVGEINEDFITQLYENKGDFKCWLPAEAPWNDLLSRINSNLEKNESSQKSELIFNERFLLSRAKFKIGWAQPSDTSTIMEVLKSEDARDVFPAGSFDYLWSVEPQKIDVVFLGYYSDYNKAQKTEHTGTGSTKWGNIRKQNVFTELVSYEAQGLLESTGLLESIELFNLNAESLEELNLYVGEELKKIREKGEWNVKTDIEFRKIIFGYELYVADLGRKIDLDVESASINQDSQIIIHFNENSKLVWSKLTEERIKKTIVMGIDRKVYSAPMIESKIGNGVTIISSLNEEFAEAIYIILNTGILSSDVKVSSFSINKD